MGYYNNNRGGNDYYGGGEHRGYGREEIVIATPPVEIVPVVAVTPTVLYTQGPNGAFIPACADQAAPAAVFVSDGAGAFVALNAGVDIGISNGVYIVGNAGCGPDYQPLGCWQPQQDFCGFHNGCIDVIKNYNAHRAVDERFTGEHPDFHNYDGSSGNNHYNIEPPQRPFNTSGQQQEQHLDHFARAQQAAAPARTIVETTPQSHSEHTYNHGAEQQGQGTGQGHSGGGRPSRPR